MPTLLGRAAANVHGVHAYTAQAHWRVGGASLEFMALSDVAMNVRQPVQTYVDLGADRLISVYGAVQGSANANGAFMPKAAGDVAKNLVGAGDPCGAGSTLEIRVHDACPAANGSAGASGGSLKASPAILTGFGVTMRVQDMLIATGAQFDIKGLDIA